MRRLAALTAMAALSFATAADAHPGHDPGEFTGKTAQRRDVSLRLTGSGTAFRAGTVRWRAACPGGRQVTGVLLLPRIPIRPGGVVRLELGEGTFFAGRFSKFWALAGTFRVVTASGCRTPVLRWSAATCVKGPLPRYVRRLLA